MGKQEGKVEDHLINLCDQHGFVCFKFTSPGCRGVPDRIVIARGHTVFIECKTPIGRLSEIQKRVIKRMRTAGADVRVCNSIESIDEFIQEAVKWRHHKYPSQDDTYEKQQHSLKYPIRKVTT